MKSEREIRAELEKLAEDLKFWQEKYNRVDMTKEGAATRRLIHANTILGVEGRIEALKWVLEED